MNIREIGSFSNESGEVIVIDPYKSDLATECFEKTNHKGDRYIFEDVVPGIYNCYNQNNDDNIIQNVIVLHNDYALQKLDDFTKSEPFILEVGIGRAFCCVDTKYYDVPQYSKYNLSICAYYSPADVLKELKNSPYSKEINSQLEDLAKKYLSENKYFDGLTIAEILEDKPHWDGFKSADVKSNHWGGDIYQRLRYEHYTIAIQGGMATWTAQPFIKFYQLKDRENIIGFIVDFDKLDSTEIPKEYSAPWNEV